GAVKILARHVVLCDPLRGDDEWAVEVVVLLLDEGGGSHSPGARGGAAEEHLGLGKTVLLQGLAEVLAELLAEGVGEDAEHALLGGRCILLSLGKPGGGGVVVGLGDLVKV